MNECIFGILFNHLPHEMLFENDLKFKKNVDSIIILYLFVYCKKFKKNIKYQKDIEIVLFLFD